MGWTAFALIYYGFPFPNTAYAKLAMGIARGDVWTQGVLYLVDSLDRDPITLTAIAFAVLLGMSQRSAAGRASASGLLLYLLYVVSIGGDFMTGRFLAVQQSRESRPTCRATIDPAPSVLFVAVRRDDAAPCGRAAICPRSAFSRRQIRPP